jgi:Gram-negative bacterial TonB protein C-terminal
LVLQHFGSATFLADVSCQPPMPGTRLQAHGRKGFDWGDMNFRVLSFLFLIVLSASLLPARQAPDPDTSSKKAANPSNHQSPVKVPKDAILVKGAWSSASDSVTPVPEAATVAQDVFSDPYFGIRYPLPQDWIQEYVGPPPSENGRYVLAQVGPPATRDGPDSASMLITAQDMFFTPLPAANALELTAYVRDHLQVDYKVETPPTLTKVADRSFSFFAYWSPVAELHWYVLATEIRCHAVQFVLTSRDTKLLDRLVLDLNRMKLPASVGATAGNGGGPFPVCVKDYAREGNVIARVDPVFTERRFNPVPVRIIIDKQGRVKHVHLISAFPDQQSAIIDALKQWKFKPYSVDGKPVEVETGILFGRAPQSLAPHSRASVQ